MLLAVSPCAGTTLANLLTVSSRSHAPSGAGTYSALSFFFFLAHEVNAHLSSVPLLLHTGYTHLLNINYPAPTGVAATMNRGK